MNRLRSICLGLLVAGAVVATSSAHANPASFYWEGAIPDTRYEFDASFGSGDFSFAWPILFAPWTIGIGDRRERVPGGIPDTSAMVRRPSVVLVPEAFAEPQVQINDGHLRASLGGRLFAIHASSGVHVAIEGFGVAGQDGSGGGMGVGLGWGSVVGLGYRRIWAGDAAPHALLLDVRLFIFPFSQPEKTFRQLGFRKLPPRPSMPRSR